MKSWNGIDATLTHPTNGRIYLFRGEEYIRHTPGMGADKGYRAKIQGNWRGLPASWDRIDAALTHPTNGRIYLFRGQEYIRYTPEMGMDKGYPAKIQGNWRGIPTLWDRIDAAVTHPTNGRIYLFRGGEYIRMTPGAGADKGYPAKIQGNWRGIPASWRQIDAALTHPTNGKMYLFRGEDYIRYTPEVGMDNGYPAKIRGNWHGIPTPAGVAPGFESIKYSLVVLRRF